MKPLLPAKPANRRSAAPAAKARVAGTEPVDLAAECQRLRLLLAEQEHLQQQLLDAVPLPLFFKDTELRYSGCNEAFARALGHPRSGILGRTAADLVPAPLAEHYQAGDLQVMTRGSQFYEGALPFADGSQHDVLFHKQLLRRSDGGIAGVVGSIQDITGQRRAERELLRLTHHDALTGLSNRSYFLRQLGGWLAEAATSGLVLAIDLDNFKILHDTLGHDFCNRLLIQVGSRLETYAGRFGLVARLGEDKFALALKAEESGESIAQDLLGLFAEPFLLGRQAVHASGCVGFTGFGAGESSAESLLRSAEIALRQAKRLGRGCYRRFDGAFECDVLEDIVLEADLRQALGRNELYLVYQPQVQLAERRLVGFEALLRWRHPERGLVSPERFVPIAERSGLIHEIGAWLLGEACRQNRAWQDHGLKALQMAVNLSGHQLKQDGFVAQVAQTLERCGLAAGSLELELTEGTVMENTEANIRLLGGLKDLGVGLAVDDFGTGYSSLAYLKRFPLDKIKIDRSFIGELPHSEEDAVIVETIIAMANRLGMRAVAEGVESEAQQEYLLRQGCELAQGYLFGRPLASAEATDLARSCARH